MICVVIRAKRRLKCYLMHCSVTKHVEIKVGYVDRNALDLRSSAVLR